MIGSNIAPKSYWNQSLWNLSSDNPSPFVRVLLGLDWEWPFPPDCDLKQSCSELISSWQREVFFIFYKNYQKYMFYMLLRGSLMFWKLFPHCKNKLSWAFTTKSSHLAGKRKWYVLLTFDLCVIWTSWLN